MALANDNTRGHIFVFESRLLVIGFEENVGFLRFSLQNYPFNVLKPFLACENHIQPIRNFEKESNGIILKIVK